MSQEGKNSDRRSVAWLFPESGRRSFTQEGELDESELDSRELI